MFKTDGSTGIVGNPTQNLTVTITSQQYSKERKIERVKGRYRFMTREGRDIPIRCDVLTYRNGSTLLTVNMPNQPGTKNETTCWQRPKEATDSVLVYIGNGPVCIRTLCENFTIDGNITRINQYYLYQSIKCM